MLPIADVNKRTQKLDRSTHRPLSAIKVRIHVASFSISDAGGIDYEMSHQQGETVVILCRLPTLEPLL
jgi:hypothetical protein